MLEWTEVLTEVVIFPSVAGVPVFDMLETPGVLVFAG
jgi:hypothetical protein